MTECGMTDSVQRKSWLQILFLLFTKYFGQIGSGQNTIIQLFVLFTFSKSRKRTNKQMRF